MVEAVCSAVGPLGAAWWPEKKGCMFVLPGDPVVDCLLRLKEASCSLSDPMAARRYVRMGRWKSPNDERHGWRFDACVSCAKGLSRLWERTPPAVSVA
jgi:hypothetical protein